MTALTGNIHPASYRDPSGFIFAHEGTLYRQVNRVFADAFELATQSGFYEAMIREGLLIPHERINQPLAGHGDWYCTLKPEPLPFISTPGEWCFSMLKDAALLTLKLARKAIDYGLVLKDATPFNVQFKGCTPVFIDSLSFDRYNEKEPWIAYRQFCETFLSPLLLSKYGRQQLPQLLAAWPEGIPLKSTKALLPLKSRLSLHTWLHIHLHASVAGRNSAAGHTTSTAFSKQKMISLLDSLQTLVQKTTLPATKTTWSAYYDEAGSRGGYLDAKKALIRSWISDLNALQTVTDLGANDGEFSRLLRAAGKHVVAADADPACINQLYEKGKAAHETGILPLVIDLVNPTPATGVNNKERASFAERIHTDLAMGLALIHHLAIGRNIPFGMIAAFFSGLADYLIIEFIPKEDPKIKEMLTQKQDIYTGYTAGSFETAFSVYYEILKKETEGLAGRTLYLMKVHSKNSDAL